MASSRPGGQGGLDIWVATREGTDAAWGAPQNLTAINTAADEFCPTPVRGDGLFFVSRQVVTGVTCGLGDIYFTRFNRNHGEPAPALRLRTSGSEHRPRRARRVAGRDRRERVPLLLELASRGAAGRARQRRHLRQRARRRRLRARRCRRRLERRRCQRHPAERPQRTDASSCSARTAGAGWGLQDIWVSTRESTNDPWSAPVNLGGAVNTSAVETRPSLSWHADQLLFGRQGPNYAGEGATGMTDIFVTTRAKLRGGS